MRTLRSHSVGYGILKGKLEETVWVEYGELIRVGGVMDGDH